MHPARSWSRRAASRASGASVKESARAVQAATQAGRRPASVRSRQKSHLTTVFAAESHWGIRQGQAMMQARQPRQWRGST